MLGKNSKLFFGISICALIAAIVLAAWGFPKIVSNQIQKKIQIENSSMMFEKWRKLPMPVSFKVYLFNVTNVDEVNRGGRPKLNQVGPYVYKQYREKTILGYGENDTVKYMLQKTYFFDAEASGTFSENDDVTVINFPYLAAILAVQRIMPSLVSVINDALQKFIPDLVDPFMRVKVKNLLFDGVFLNCSEEATDDGLGLICGKVKLDKRPTMRPAEDAPGFYFSMFSHLNRTPSGPYEMIRGREDIRELGHIVSYKEKRTLTAWGDPYCGMINGTDSSIFPPIDESNVPQRIYTFQPDICRSMYVDFVDKRSIFNMTAYYYELSNMPLASKSANPDNKCFCKENWSGNHDGCLMMGLLNLLPCQGAPAVASLPHFYLASEEILEFFASGVKPDPEKHKSFIYLEPKTGVVIKGAQRLQFNIELRNIPDAPQLLNVSTGLFPLLWIEEGAEIPATIQSELQHSHTLLGYVEAARWALLGAALLAAAAATISAMRAGPCRKNTVSFMLRPGQVANTGDINKFT
ncbi:sensory neuron membrane protein 2-like [Epargyreus clarus]|uniref:sensory neuron membrane protein 2-like n=1 Tax=Epargyreus clarus TaxID=520877 RepID=UPI003C2B744A